MKPIVPRTLTVLVDTREQRPLLFPSSFLYHPSRRAGGAVRVLLTWERHTLNAGDYMLKGYGGIVRVERKGSLEELAKNLLSKDFTRSSAAFRKLAHSCAHPIVLLEESPVVLMRPTPYVENPALVMDTWHRLMAERSVHWIWCGRCKSTNSRRLLGLQIVRLMFAYVIAHQAAQGVGGAGETGAGKFTEKRVKSLDPHKLVV